MGQLYANNVEVELDQQILASDTTIRFKYPDAGHLPILDDGDYFMLTIHEPTIPEDKWEVVKVTSVSDYATHTYNVVRGQEGTTKRSWSATDVASMRLTSESIERIRNEATFDSVLVGNDGGILVDNSGDILVATLSSVNLPPEYYTTIPINDSYIEQDMGSKQYSWWRFYYDPQNLPVDYSVVIRHNNNTGNESIRYRLYNRSGNLIGLSQDTTDASDTDGIIVTDGVRMDAGMYYLRVENIAVAATLDLQITFGYEPT